jgi:hypothetical protein
MTSLADPFSALIKRWDGSEPKEIKKVKFKKNTETR